MKNLSCEAPSSKLKDWIKSHSDVLHNPWAEDEFEDRSSVSRNCKVLDPLHGRETLYTNCTKKYGGDIVYTWDNGDTFSGHINDGVRDGWGLVTSPDNDIEMLSGHWVDGKLTGLGRMVKNKDTLVTQGWFREGCLHGLVRKTIIKKFRTFVQHVSWLGRYGSGVPVGTIWEWQEGGGYLTGVVDDDGTFTGDNIAFVYPDFCTAILGRFNNGVLVDGVSAALADVSIEDDIAVAKWSVIGSPEPEMHVTHFKSTEEDAGPQPLVRDPYESRTVEVRPSSLGGGGDGLFVKRKIIKGEVVAFYNGIRLLPKFGRNENWDNSGYKIFTNTNEVCGERLDLPGDMVNLENYSATLAHKINHSFYFNCTEWFFHHPRHGLIPSMITTKDLEPGDELFLHYGYDPRNCPEWYSQVLAQFMEENPELDMDQAANPKILEREEKPSWYHSINGIKLQDSI